MQVQPYLYFEGRTEEALEFYKKTIGAQVDMMMRMSEAPPGAEAPGESCRGEIDTSDKILHAYFRVGDTAVMASDGMCSGTAEFKGFSLTLTVANDAEAKQKFEALSAGGAVQVPLAPTFFASSFGMLHDRFGVLWIVIAPLPI